jgi:ABC-type uncharacterized transport system substrate-binding protein
LNDKKVREAPNAISVSMKIPAASQLQWLRRFLPRAKRIGVLYHPARNGHWVEEAGKVARKLGLEWIWEMTKKAASSQ